jgi:PHD/YefM family antitoxin component YafN of YafNO toxin-antitoxin module
MSTTPIALEGETGHGGLNAREGLIRRGKSFVLGMRWLSAVNTLTKMRSSAFGRQIEKELGNLITTNAVVTLQLHRRDAAVVMPVAQYEQLLQLKEAYTQLLESKADTIIADATRDFDRLYQQIIAPQSRKATDALFAASPEELRSTYRPGQTEKQ